MKKLEFQHILFRIREKLKQFRYPVLILAAGIFLMLLPTEKAPPKQPEPIAQPETADLEQRLQNLLEQVSGAGRVEVLLTLERGPLQTYQTDLQETVTPEQRQRQLETVRLSGGGEDRPLLQASSCPMYRGAVVVCDGAEQPTVKLRIVQAVSSATGLGSDKISVIRMSGK